MVRVSVLCDRESAAWRCPKLLPARGAAFGCCALPASRCCDNPELRGPSAHADRDMDVLRREVAAVLAQHLAAGSWELQEHIDSETSFRDGKRLLALHLT